MESPCLEVFKKSMDVVQRDMVHRHGGDGLAAGLDDLKSSFPTLRILCSKGSCIVNLLQEVQTKEDTGTVGTRF